MIIYEVYFRPEAEDDLKDLSRDIRNRILKAIRQRLIQNPGLYGKPLGGKLKGLRRIRVGDYRIAYQINLSKVIIWAIKHRHEIYDELPYRYHF